MLDTATISGQWRQIAAPAERPLTFDVLVVESDLDHIDVLTRELQRHGHTVTAVETASEALRAHDEASIVLLDLELPDLDGIEVCRAIRSASDVPLIAVTARESELDLVLGFQAGVDDYVVKPYRFRELLARMEAVMRRSLPATATPSRVIVYGPLRIDASTREVFLDDCPVLVTPKEFDLLYLLASSPGCVLPRKQIMRRVWGDCWSRRTLDTHVSSLRSKLGSAGWVVTVRGVGFRIGEG
ncbi:response regulator transcription factor [Nocardia sp. CNY236]|uniref:response regulator transcription factor n=1 Tax=Nocardia sp. CNY236 TaxID=1169152 RepID=UPI000427BB2D|nr:response regulator transcription factor [Nocardia sp. CNY236]